MNNIQSTAFFIHHYKDIVFVVILSTKIARRNHFEARYGEKKVQFIHNLAFSRLSKSVFTITSLVYCDKTIQQIVLNFLYCKYLEMVKNWGLCFFKAKNTKKVNITSVFAEFSRTPPMIRKSILVSWTVRVIVTIFLRMGIFQKRFQKKLRRIK